MERVVMPQKYVAPSMHERTATVIRVVDGDTLHVAADLGCDITVNMTLRLYGINAPETSTDAGKTASAFTAQWVADHGPIFQLRTVKDKKEKFGRYLADLIPADGTPSLCASLLATGNAVVYLP